MICLSRNYTVCFDNQHLHKWGGFPLTFELNKKTVAILGTSSIATEIAKKLKCFNMKVIGFSRHSGKAEYFDEVVQKDRLNYIITESDFIVSTLPLTDETKGLIDYNLMCKMKINAVIINVSRGPIFVEKDLLKALKENIIAGAGLDVFEKEPLPSESELWDLKNVIVTAHSSGNGDYLEERIRNIFVENLYLYPDVKKMKNIINPK